MTIINYFDEYILFSVIMVIALREIMYNFATDNPKMHKTE